ncbi:DUF4386 domain-containing protein [Aeromicrobium sp. A1-2]|uniref:DUF4386 domain-containing protein n=1 Tax=Aeromicrobium sp. A1-2 TaxID=2107713 RepID=UPI000E509B4F|nr:DUF4386 domain-containing protein [Aeromicrobium sp. A1-2]AXT85752.1 DUF4386 domain-containing protein [Aeromicrobium sp. A1-2]
MTTATTASPRPESITPELVRTARTTGLLYLGLALTGLVGYLLIRSQLFAADDAEATLANLTEREALARLGIVMEMGVVITQALVALWFYRLFRSVNTFAAGSIAAFGLVNAVAMLGSVALIATALDVSRDATLAVGGGAAGTAQLLYVVSEHLWLIGGIFFGLWLIPMGWLVRQSGWMPDLLGWVLMVGGAGYVVSALLSHVLPDAGVTLDLLVVPATVGELWMVGYLCVRGVRRA